MLKHLNSVKKWLVALAVSISAASFLQVTHAENLEQDAKYSQIEEKGQTEENHQQSYFYLGSKIGLNIYQHSCEDWNISCDKEDFAAGIFTGYQLDDIFAVELTYVDLGDAKASYLERSTKQNYTGSMTGIDLSGLASINIDDNFSAFAKAGVFHWQGENSGPYHQTKARGFSPSIGVGLTYQLTDTWQVRTDYQYMHGLGDDSIGGTNAHLVAIGISYQFKPRTVTVIEMTGITLEKVTFAVLFDFDKEEIIQPESLSVVIHRLTLYPQATVSLFAYSDAKGSEEYNLQLSARRLSSVHQYLIDNGVNENQINIHNFGEKSPVIDNDSADHRHLNRHVQVLLPQVAIPSSQEKK